VYVREPEYRLLRLLTCGSVDVCKSKLIGRLRARRIPSSISSARAPLKISAHRMGVFFDALG
jgi:hypothetical protein